MRALIRAIDKFSLKHRQFGIRNLMLYIIIGYAAIFLLSTMDTTYTIVSLIRFDPALILRGQIWRLVTWVFYPTAGSFSITSLFFTAIMLYFYYFIGSTLEREWGTAKFNIYYILGVLLHIIFAFIVWALAGASVPLSSSYLNLSMFFAFAVFYPDQRVLLFFFIPIKIKWLALAGGAFFLITIISSIIGGDYYSIIVPIAAVLNFFIFCSEDLMRYLRPYRARASGQAINFRRAAKKQQKKKPLSRTDINAQSAGVPTPSIPNWSFAIVRNAPAITLFVSTTSTITSTFNKRSRYNNVESTYCSY